MGNASGGMEGKRALRRRGAPGGPVGHALARGEQASHAVGPSAMEPALGVAESVARGDGQTEAVPVPGRGGTGSEMVAWAPRSQPSAPDVRTPRAGLLSASTALRVEDPSVRWSSEASAADQGVSGQDQAENRRVPPQ